MRRTERDPRPGRDRAFAARRRRGAGLLGGAITVAGLCACGGIAPPPRTANPADPSPPAGAVSSGPLRTAIPTLPGDVQVPLAPATYDGRHPCAQVTQTVARPAAPADCQDLWHAVDSAYVPGQDLMDPSPMPATALVGREIPPADGQAAATAYVRMEAFGLWAIPYTARMVIATLDTARYVHHDPVLALMNQNAYIAAVPPCGYPSALRVAGIDAAARAYLEQRGWPGASGTAIVATFPACPGVDVTTVDAGGQRSTTTKRFGQDRPGSVVASGSVQDIAPFGSVWVVDGYEPCGAPALSPVCG